VILYTHRKMSVFTVVLYSICDCWWLHIDIFTEARYVVTVSTVIDGTVIIICGAQGTSVIIANVGIRCHVVVGRLLCRPTVLLLLAPESTMAFPQSLACGPNSRLSYIIGVTAVPDVTFSCVCSIVLFLLTTALLRSLVTGLGNCGNSGMVCTIRVSYAYIVDMPK